ncbi:MAG: D-tyrosyl-tRNA(Tyr) deacylase [Lachnospiraceae bacterium]|nr:D-tyrosyl-tRNA(Tyr) deacylase [Lachnospiraceae bacterium]
MRFVIQCVDNAKVEIDGSVVGKIGKGYLVLAGISETDTRNTADRMIEKMLKLRIFEDENGKTNLSLAAVGGEILLVSQFTLYADCRKGNRPSFIKAGSPQHAEELYNYLIEKCEQLTGRKPQTGEFGALMKVHLTNSGPFTMLMDSEELGY